MNWSSWNECIGMGGYALYVWGSFGVVLAALVGEQLALALRRRDTRAAIAAALRTGRRA
jgi:heme exporter protein D